MPRMRLGIAGVIFGAVLMVPGSASAGIIDFIYEMSGPQMIGLVYYCEVNIPTLQTECRVFDRRIVGNAGRRDQRRLWLILGGGTYVSTGKNSEIRRFKTLGVRLQSFEPVLEVRSITNESFVMHHGVIGASYFFLEGDGFRNFDKLGWKFVPVGISFRNGWNFAYNLRVFPNGFTADEFGVGSRTPDLNRRREFLNGVVVGYKYEF